MSLTELMVSMVARRDRDFAGRAYHAPSIDGWDGQAPSAACKVAPSPANHGLSPATGESPSAPAQLGIVMGMRVRMGHGRSHLTQPSTIRLDTYSYSDKCPGQPRPSQPAPTFDRLLPDRHISPAPSLFSSTRPHSYTNHQAHTMFHPALLLYPRAQLMTHSPGPQTGRVHTPAALWSVDGPNSLHNIHDFYLQKAIEHR